MCDPLLLSVFTRACIALLAIASALPCWSQSASPTITRDECDQRLGVRIGQEGKDVIWVPTHDSLVTAMLEAAQVGPSDYVIDLGAGDGKIAIAAAKHFGARALGIEYDPGMVRLARCYVEADGVADKVEIRQADIFDTDLSKATVVTLYLTPKLNRKLRSTLLALEPGTRIISNRFDMDSWRPDRVITVADHPNEGLLWIVPERLAGIWSLSSTAGNDLRIQFTQRFQRVTARLLGDRRHSIRDVHLQGQKIELTLHSPSESVRLRGEILDGAMRLASADGSRYVGRKE